jgi:hypothetical protein
MLGDDRAEPVGDLIECLAKADLLIVAAGGALERPEQSPRPVMLLLGLEALGASVAARHRLGLVAADVDDAVVLVDRQQGAATAAADPAK